MLTPGLFTPRSPFGYDVVRQKFNELKQEGGQAARSLRAIYAHLRAPRGKNATGTGAQCAQTARRLAARMSVRGGEGR